MSLLQVCNNLKVEVDSVQAVLKNHLDQCGTILNVVGKKYQNCVNHKLSTDVVPVCIHRMLRRNSRTV